MSHTLVRVWNLYMYIYAYFLLQMSPSNESHHFNCHRICMTTSQGRVHICDLVCMLLIKFDHFSTIAFLVMLVDGLYNFSRPSAIWRHIAYDKHNYSTECSEKEAISQLLHSTLPFASSIRAHKRAPHTIYTVCSALRRHCKVCLLSSLISCSQFFSGIRRLWWEWCIQPVRKKNRSS